MRFTTTISAALLAMATLAVSSASAATSHVCLDVRNISSSESKDGKILTFRMKDGTVLQNHLKQACDGLIFGGFSWVTEPNSQVCENTQTLRVFKTREICQLGAFDAPVKMSPSKG